MSRTWPDPESGGTFLEDEEESGDGSTSNCRPIMEVSRIGSTHNSLVLRPKLFTV